MARTAAEEIRIRQLERLIADNPNDANQHYQLARIYLAAEDWPQAIRVLEKATTLDPSFTQASFELGCAYTRMRNFESAIREWEKMVDIDGELRLDDIDYSRNALINGTQQIWDKYDENNKDDTIFKYYSLGVARLVLGKTLAAAESFTQVLKLNDKFEKALYYRSRTYRMLGMMREAGMDLQRHLELKPRDPYANFALGCCLMEVGRTPQAIQVFNKAITDKPGYYKAHLQIGQCYHTLMQYDQAMEHAKKALQIRPDSCEAFLLQGRCLEQQYRMDEAAEIYERAIACNPNSKDAHLTVGLLYKNLGRHQAAVRHLQKTVEIDPNEVEAYYMLGVLLCGLKKYQDALAPLRRCLELTPNHTYARYTLGKACLACEQVEEAIECFNQTLQQNPNDVKTLTALGMAHFQKKQLEQAKHQFLEVIGRNPREAEAHYYLGATLFQMNEFDKAIESYQKASQAYGDNHLEKFTSGAVASYHRKYKEALRLFREATEFRPDSEADVSKFATLQLLATVGITHAQQGLVLEEFDQKRKQTFKAFVYAIASFLDARDKYTRYHSYRVATIGAMLARHIGLPEEVVEGIEMGGFMHDVGKIGIPEHVLNKRGKLTDEEYELIKQHPVIGYEGLKQVAFPWPQVMPIVRFHHEKWNGTGYPDRLAGDEIPFEAQIIGIADHFDALTTNRPYRAAFTYQKALDIMREESGKYFNPDLLEEFAMVTDTNEFLLELSPPAPVDASGNHVLPSMEENWKSLGGNKEVVTGYSSYA